MLILDPSELEAVMRVMDVTRRARVAGLLLAGALVGGVGGVVISQLGTATAASPTPTPSLGPQAPDRHGPGEPGPRGLGLLGGPGGRVLHGEATVQRPGGGTQVIRFQHGTITAIGGSAVTVRSTDGFTATYTVNSTTRISLNGDSGSLSRLKKNDDVRVFAVQNGAANVAKAVLDGMPKAFGFGRFGHHMGMRMEGSTAG